MSPVEDPSPIVPPLPVAASFGFEELEPQPDVETISTSATSGSGHSQDVRIIVAPID
jgi:hypothetical protein